MKTKTKQEKDNVLYLFINDNQLSIINKKRITVFYTDNNKNKVKKTESWTKKISTSTNRALMLNYFCGTMRKKRGMDITSINKHRKIWPPRIFSLK